MLARVRIREGDLSVLDPPMFRSHKATLLRNVVELAVSIVFPAGSYWAPCCQRPVYIDTTIVPFLQ